MRKWWLWTTFEYCLLSQVLSIDETTVDSYTVENVERQDNVEQHGKRFRFMSAERWQAVWKCRRGIVSVVYVNCFKIMYKDMRIMSSRIIVAKNNTQFARSTVCNLWEIFQIHFQWKNNQSLANVNGQFKHTINLRRSQEYLPTCVLNITVLTVC